MSKPKIASVYMLIPREGGRSINDPADNAGCGQTDPAAAPGAWPDPPPDIPGAQRPDASPMHGARELPILLSMAEVAEMFGRAPRTIRGWIRCGHLTPVRVGRACFIPMEQIDALLSQSK